MKAIREAATRIHRTTMSYGQSIRESLARQGMIGRAEPRHIEGWMRLERGTLDSLSRAEFDREVRTAVACIEASSKEENDNLAKSYGL